MSGTKDMSQRVVAVLRRARNDQDFRTILLRAAPDELSNLGLKPGQQAVLLSNLWLTSPFQPEDLPDWDARYGHAFSWVDYRSQAIPWTPFKTPFQHAKVAFITTAGLYRCEDSPFDTQDEEHAEPSYRIIPTETSPEAFCANHPLRLAAPGPDVESHDFIPLRPRSS